MWIWIEKLVADDVCRFVDQSNAQLAAKVKHLRQQLGQARSCNDLNPTPQK
jgi:hypothetical protein